MKDEASFITDVNKKLDPFIKKAINDKIFPGAAVGISIHDGIKKNIFTGAWGYSSLLPQQKKIKKEVMFDLASLTKPLATTLAILCLIQEKKLDLDFPLSSLLRQEIPSDKKDIRLRHLLNHCSGLAAYHPFYENLILIEENERRKSTLLHSILQDTLIYPIGGKALYSDLGFILLGMIVEIQSGQPLDIYVKNRVMAPLMLAEKIIFNPLQKNIKEFAATQDCPWRKKILAGEVDDENTYAVGGVSGQAGLFAAVDDVLSLTSFLLDVWHYQASHPYFSKEILKEFFKRQKMVADSTWGLGFDTPSEIGSAAGRFLSRESVGHLGFTGTSFWIDPKRGLVIVLLTNRIHPSRENNKIRAFRPLFHEYVIEAL